MKDLHIHTKYSDGEFDEFDILNEIEKTSVKEFAICDHDTIEGSKKVFNLIKGKQTDLIFHTGVELTSHFKEFARGVNMHILVHDFDLESPIMQEIIEEANILRRNKVDKMVAYVESVYRIKIPGEKLEEKLKTTNSFGKPHLYSLLCTLGDFDREEYYRTMDKLSTKEFKLDIAKTLPKLKGVGTIVLAHPVEIMKEYNYDIDTIEKIVIELKKLGLNGIECYHSSQDKELQIKLSQIVSKYDLIESYGSDYHGPNVKPGLEIGTIMKV